MQLACSDPPTRVILYLYVRPLYHMEFKVDSGIESLCIMIPWDWTLYASWFWVKILSSGFRSILRSFITWNLCIVLEREPAIFFLGCHELLDHMGMLRFEYTIIQSKAMWKFFMIVTICFLWIINKFQVPTNLSGYSHILHSSKSHESFLTITTLETLSGLFDSQLKQRGHMCYVGITISLYLQVASP